MRTLLLLAPLLALACASSRTVPCVNAQTTTPTASGSATVTFRTRRALVIGNGNYASLPPLASAITEAQAVHGALQASGFEATLLTNATADRMRSALAALEQESSAEDLVLVYFAGHGFDDVRRHNRWVPVDAALSEQTMGSAPDAIDVGGRLSRRARATLLFSTGARNNPFVPNSPRPSGTRKPGISLGADPAPASIGGALFVSACAPGEVSSDDLALQFGQVFAREVRAGATLTALLSSLSQVASGSSSQQHLWIEGSLLAPFVLRSSSASR